MVTTVIKLILFDEPVADCFIFPRLRLLEQSISFKPATRAYKALYLDSSPYLTDLLEHHNPTRSMCNPCTHLISVCRNNLFLVHLTFAYLHLRLHIHQSPLFPSIRKYLKTLFQLAFSVP